MSIQTVEDLTQLVQAEIERISLPEIRSAVTPLLVPPKLHMRNWDYGKPGKVLPCWTVLEHRESGTGIAYSDFGFGPKCSWGLVFLAASKNWFGDDAGWFSTLEDAFCESFALGDLPVWNLVRKEENGNKEIIETALSTDDVIDKLNRLNQSNKSSPTRPMDWARYEMEKRREGV